MPDSLDSTAATTASTLKKSDQNLVWLDCEMTGLQPEVDRIIEIAVIVTDPMLEQRVEGPVLVIHQSTTQLDKIGYRDGIVEPDPQLIFNGVLLQRFQSKKNLD